MQKNNLNIIEKKVDPDIEKRLKRKFIAFDTETTGLSSKNDRIIEIGAVLVEDGQITDTFGTLINAGIDVPYRVSLINHITNDMLFAAPTEREVYKEFCHFMADAFCDRDDKIIVCAHNAKFDMRFLKERFERLSIPANIEFVDTLSFSKKKVFGLENYKQETLAKYFDIDTGCAHRALDDAIALSGIINELLKI